MPDDSRVKRSRWTRAATDYDHRRVGLNRAIRNSWDTGGWVSLGAGVGRGYKFRSVRRRFPWKFLFR